jgi:chemotaxis family two-component system response regulator Rcp1
MKRYSTRAIEICLIGSSQSDVFAAQETLASSKLLNNLHVLDTSEHALRYLRREQEFADAPPTDLILLDLESEQGYRLLETIKGDPKLRATALAALIGTVTAGAIETANRSKADFLVEKPLDWLELYDIVRATVSWWLCVVDIGQPTATLNG